MNRTKRLLIQVALWLFIGVIIWLNLDAAPEILQENLVSFAFQMFLIGSLIYYTAPKFLFKNKYVLFAILSLVVIVISSYIISNLFGSPMAKPESLHDFEFGPPPPELRKPPSKFLIHLLMLSVSYILAIVIEAFMFLKTKEEETILSEKINLQNELKLLKSQINPHFLFNSLNNIYTLAGIDSNKTKKSIINLSDMLRYVLYECDQDRVAIQKEVEYIENYIKLFSLKSSNKYPINTQFKIVNNTASIAPMLFIPFIENALKHSNIDDIKNSFINIKLNADDNKIHFEVENSLPKTTFNKDEVGGIGLENVKKRLAILYPEKHELKITENESSFKVKLNLKLHENH